MRRTTIGLRELKQNPSDVISQAEAGTQFEVLRNGKATDVVIERRTTTKKQWVSAADLALTFHEIASDTTGWLEVDDAHRDNDPLVDPWNAAK